MMNQLDHSEASDQTVSPCKLDVIFSIFFAGQFIGGLVGLYSLGSQAYNVSFFMHASPLGWFIAIETSLCLARSILFSK